MLGAIGADQVKDFVDKLIGNEIMKQVSHRIQEYLTRPLPVGESGEGIQPVSVQRHPEGIVLRVAAAAGQALAHPAGPAVGAAGTKIL